MVNGKNLCQDSLSKSATWLQETNFPNSEFPINSLNLVTFDLDMSDMTRIVFNKDVCLFISWGYLFTNLKPWSYEMISSQEAIPLVSIYANEYIILGLLGLSLQLYWAVLKHWHTATLIKTV